MGVDTYLLVAWWMGLIGITLRLLLMLIGDYPRTTKHSSASDTAMLLIGSFFFAWVCYLRFFV